MRETSNALQELEKSVLAAHARHDHAALVGFYETAANLTEQTGDIDAACFFLTHAYIYALEQAHPGTLRLRSRLVAHGREN